MSHEQTVEPGKDTPAAAEIDATSAPDAPSFSVAPWVWSAFAFLAYSILGTLQWRRFESPSYDLAIFAQTLQRYAHFQAPIVHVKGADYNILGDHFHPLLAVLTPLWWIHGSALTLLIAQAFLLAVSVFVVARTANSLLGSEASWLIGGAYALSWGVQWAANVQFHEVALAAPILAIGLSQLMLKNPLSATLWLGSLVFVKEDLCLTVAALGVVVWLVSRSWKLGLGLTAWGTVWFVLIMRVLLPSLNHKNGYDHAKNLSVSDILADPGATIVNIFSNDKKMTTLVMLLLCVAFLMFRSWIGLALLPTLTWRFLSNTDGHWGPTWHYSLVLMPIAFLAAVDAIGRLDRSKWEFARRYALHAPAVLLAFAITTLPTQPLWDLRKPERWEASERGASAQQVLQHVEAGKSVATDISLMAYLIPQHDVYYIGQQGNPVTDYIVIDNVAGGWNMQVDATSYAGQVYPGTQWQRVFNEDGYDVVKRVG